MLLQLFRYISPELDPEEEPGPELSLPPCLDAGLDAGLGCPAALLLTLAWYSLVELTDLAVSAGR